MSEGNAGLGWPRAALVDASCGSSLATALSGISELEGEGLEPLGVSFARVAGAVLRRCGVRVCVRVCALGGEYRLAAAHRAGAGLRPSFLETADGFNELESKEIIAYMVAAVVRRAAGGAGWG